MMNRHIRSLRGAFCTPCIATTAGIRPNHFRLQNRQYPALLDHNVTSNNAHTTNLSLQRSNQFSNFSKSEYIHPLSQIVLEHLQSRHADWIQSMGLDKGLELNKDGTFVLRFDKGADVEKSNNEEEVESIWTMYEPTEKKHYLCISKNKLVGRYLLQDNTKPAWHSEKRSTPERVQDAVDEMVVKVNEIC